MAGNRSTTLTAGGTQIRNILNVGVTDAAWTAISLGAKDTCRAISAGLRSGGSFKLSHMSEGTKYKTIQENINMDIVKELSKTLFYIQTTSGDDTLECIILD